MKNLEKQLFLYYYSTYARALQRDEKTRNLFKVKQVYTSSVLLYGENANCHLSKWPSSEHPRERRRHDNNKPEIHARAWTNLYRCETALQGYMLSPTTLAI